MKFFTAPLASAALLVLGALSPTAVDAHSWLVKPVSRETGSRTDIDGSVGCPSNTPGRSTSFKAGESIDVGYWRNNHLGGFIRWSFAPRGQESKATFDKNAFYYTCRESGPTCLPKGTNTKYAGDNSDANSISCGDKITLPDWLPAGDYVLQWTWFGVGSSSGNIGWAEPQFRSCADIKLTTSGAKSAAPSCPAFVGGDRVTKLTGQGNDKCFYFYTTDIVTSQYKGSNTDYEGNYKFGVPAQVQKCGGGGGAVSNEATKAPASGNAPAPAANNNKGNTRPASTPATGASPTPSSTRRIRTAKPSTGNGKVGGEADEPVATPKPSCKTKRRN
ncbi:hypothetical protein Gpo141_00000944 [Globisporangium polare]